MSGIFIPRNHRDWLLFEERNCDSCVAFAGSKIGKPCPIHIAAMCGETPDEWIADEYGLGRCAAWRRKNVFPERVGS
jgi:hypothetical protein